MNLYLVRHGLTPWNVSGRLQGWTDTSLTIEGLEQAERTAEFFADFRRRQRTSFYTIYSSPLRRAWLTATIIGEHLNLAPISVPDLREMAGGLIEGLTRDEWQSRFPDVAAAWRDRNNLDFGWPGGETRRAFRARCLRAISEIVAHHKSYDNIIVVTHGGVIKSYLTSAGIDDPAGPQSYDSDNCGITHLQFMTDDTLGKSELWSVGCLRQFNYVHHLHDEVGVLAGVGNADLALL
ncbi:MAG: histidine phosphatase family protein [Chloroflexia bacterium]